MSPRLPRITGKKLVSLLEHKGFRVIRVRSSHHYMKHDDGRCTVVSVHTGEIIGPGLLSKILASAELTAEELIS